MLLYKINNIVRIEFIWGSESVGLRAEYHFKQECIQVIYILPALYRTGGVSVRETPLNRELLPRGQTDTCENITLPQTTFAGGNDNVNRWQTLQCF